VSEYDIPPYTRKQVVLFLGRVDGQVKLQESEARDHKWVKAEDLKDHLHPDTYQVCLPLLR
jgi:isopentenyldiphosphate isomerase